MARTGRPKSAVKREWEKLTVLLTAEEMAAVDEAKERMTKANADGSGRTWSRSDIVRRWLSFGREHEGKTKR